VKLSENSVLSNPADWVQFLGMYVRHQSLFIIMSGLLLDYPSDNDDDFVAAAAVAVVVFKCRRRPSHVPTRLDWIAHVSRDLLRCMTKCKSWEMKILRKISRLTSQKKNARWPPKISSFFSRFFSWDFWFVWVKKPWDLRFSWNVNLEILICMTGLSFVRLLLNYTDRRTRNRTHLFES